MVLARTEHTFPTCAVRMGPNSRAVIHVSSHNDIHYAPVAAGTSVLVTLTKIFAMHRVQVVYATETVPIYAQI